MRIYRQKWNRSENMAEEIAVVLKGEIDHHRAGELKDELDKIIDRIHPRMMVLDFKNVTMMDSAGIGLLLGRYKRLRETGGTLCVKRVNCQIDKIFKVSGLYQVVKRL